VQPIDKRCKPLDQFGIAISELIKCHGLLLEYRQDPIRRLAPIDHGGKWVVAEISASKSGVLGQGDIKEGCEVGGNGGCIGHRRHGFGA